MSVAFAFPVSSKQRIRAAAPAYTPNRTLLRTTAHLDALQGTRRELLRALCQLVNTTDLTLEACLVDVEDSDWHMVAARSGGCIAVCITASILLW